MIKTKYEIACNTPSDINEHLPILKKFSSRVDHITEMGVRDVVSTWAFLIGTPKKLVGIDINRSPNIDLVEIYSKRANIDFEFIQGSTLDIEIEETDFLFIDTYHHYEQLKRELDKHAGKVRKYIGFHDTTLFEHTSEFLDFLDIDFPIEPDKGLWDAIIEFLSEHDEWVIKERLTNNNGLTILERV